MTALPLLTLIAILATLAVNTLSNFFSPGGQNVGEISNTVLGGVLITPASYAFAIWGLIYLGLIAYGIFQLRPRLHADRSIRQASQLLIVACLAQVGWIFLFTLQLFWASVGLMLLILLPLMGAYLALNRAGGMRPSRQRRWLVQIPFSVYFAWISVATVINIAAALYISQWGGFGIGDRLWTVVMMGIAAGIAAAVLLQYRDRAFGLVIVWALGAIAVRHSDIALLWITAAGLALGLVALVLLLPWLVPARSRLPKSASAPPAVDPK
ncbi:MAG: tryptophan-rich sensory protein [Cyanobacteria bacterium P01_H01_bin.119]